MEANIKMKVENKDIVENNITESKKTIKKKGEGKQQSINNKEKKNNIKKKDEDLFVRFVIKASKHKIEEKFDKIAAKYSSDIKLPGFRKGKIPIEVIKNRYKKSLTDEVITEVINDLTSEKIRKKKIEVVSSPIVEKINYKEGGDLTADIVVETFPTVVLPDLDKVEIEISKKDFDLEKYNEEKQINAVLEANKRKIPIGDKSIKDDDLVFVKLQSKMLDTKRMSPKKEVSFVLNKNEEFEIFDLYKEIVGKKIKDKVIFKRKYLDNYKKKIWSGKDVEHHIEVERVFEFVKPSFDKDFLKSIGYKDEESFKKKIKDEYEQYKRNYREDKIFKHIIDKLDEIVDFTTPETVIEQEVKRLDTQNSHLIKSTNEKQKIEYIDSLKTRAKKSVKFSFIIDAVEKKFNIKVSNEEIEEEYKKIAEINKVPIPEVRKFYLNHEKKRDLEESMLRIKVIDFLKTKIKIKEV